LLLTEQPNLGNVLGFPSSIKPPSFDHEDVSFGGEDLDYIS
jgi:hypothetical protein